MSLKYRNTIYRSAMRLASEQCGNSRMDLPFPPAARAKFYNTHGEASAATRRLAPAVGPARSLGAGSVVESASPPAFISEHDLH
jgi:hypothetical protein